MVGPGQSVMEEAVFRQIYDSHLEDLLRYAYFRTGNLSDAEDVVAQVFLKAWEALPAYEQRGIPFLHWLYRIAGNTIKNTYRRREVPVGWEPMATAAAAQQELESTADRLDLGRLLANLPEKQQQVLVLRYVQDLSVRDVAKIMGKSENAIKQLAFRALQSLREGVGIDEENR
ncbi:MAG: RNA polymerase sigma factor [Bacillota bacterium]|jgi:RNA polymerase sigma-70 factor (ECF subfamily)